jgi:hypothetical protein
VADNGDPPGVGAELASALPLAGAKGIARLLINQPRMLDAYVQAVRTCESFADANSQAELLPSIQRLTEAQSSELVMAFNENVQINESFGFNGSRPAYYGDGLAKHLACVTGINHMVRNGALARHE